MNSSESAEQIVKISLEGMEVACKISGQLIERFAVMLYTMAKDNKASKGKTNLNNMLKSGSPLQIFSLKENELKKFHEESKKYGVLYTALIDKKHPDRDGVIDIMVRANDAPKVNRIVERFKLSAIDMATIKSEIEKDKIEQMIKEANEKGIPIKSMGDKEQEENKSKPIGKEKNYSNPKLAKTEKSPLLEPSLENKKISGVASNKNKPSVRKELNEIKEELKQRRNKQQKTLQHIAPKKKRKKVR